VLDAGAEVVPVINAVLLRDRSISVIPNTFFLITVSSHLLRVSKKSQKEFYSKKFDLRISTSQLRSVSCSG
jgi:ribosomal protein L28